MLAILKRDVFIKNQTRLFFIIFVLFVSGVLQSQQMLFRHYDVNDGLESNTVYDISQDDQGLMWFATKGGLNRFDSKNFEVFKKNKQDTLSIGNNFIRVVKKYTKDIYLVGTQDGIFQFDLRKETFLRLHPTISITISDILIDDNGYWIATDGAGLFFYDNTLNKIRNYSTFGDGIEIGISRTRAVVKDDLGQIWVGTYGNGIYVLNTKDNSYRNYKSGTDSGSLSNNFILTMYKALDGTIWSGTLTGGLNYWSAEKNRFFNYQQKEGQNSISDNIVRAINQRNIDELLIGTEKGLNILNLKTNEFRSYQNTPNSKSLSDNAVWCIFVDKEKNIWIGTYFGGVDYLNMSENTIAHFYKDVNDENSLSGNAVSCFYEDSFGNLWIGTEDGGLNYYNPKTNTFLPLPKKLNSKLLSYPNIHSILEDEKDRLWIGTYSGGLDVYDQKSGKVTNYKNNELSSSISNNSVFTSFQDSRNRIWLGTLNGLNIFNQDGNFSQVSEFNLDKSKINVIMEDLIGTIWIATDHQGLFSYNYEQNRWKKHSIISNLRLTESTNIISLIEDKHGTFWIGLDGEGLLTYKPIANEFEKIDLAGKIETVYSILEDDHSGIWVSSNKGILYYNYETHDIIHYTEWDYLQSKQFNYGAGIKDSSGNLYFGGINGFNVFKPEKLLNNNQDDPYELLITKLQINNIQINSKSNIVSLDEVINHTTYLELNHNQTFINLEFSDINYQAPGSMNYEYKMENFNEGWNYIGKENKATYTNLAPGDYIFKVRSNNGQIQKTNEIKIHINPPFYKHSLAYALYVILFIGALFLAIDLLKKRGIQKNNRRLEKFKIKEEKLFYKRKIEFFTDMAHEIRTPLTLITSPLDLLLEKKLKKKEVSSQLNFMKKNADRLLVLTNHLLDFRRVESDSFTLTKRKIELIDFIENIYSRFSGHANKKNIRFDFNCNEKELYIEADTEALTKIISNLLSNAFKFARTEVVIEIALKINSETDNSQVNINIKDDGIGIPKSQLKDIFNRFFKVTEGEHEYNNLGGTGIGLSLAKLLTEKHNGKLEVESVVGQYTIFKTILPVSISQSKKVFENLNSLKTEEINDGADKVHILIVEDNADLLTFLSTTFKKEDFAVHKAKNGLEAIEIIDSKRVDIVLSDVMMSGLNGLDLCKKIKENFETSHIPIILLSAKSDVESKIEGLEIGADAYISKPFKFNHVLVTVNNLLDSREQLRTKYIEEPFVKIASLAHNARDEKFVERIVDVIEEHISDLNFSVENLSTEVAMSRSGIHKKLKTITGQSPNELIRIIRLKKAVLLLQEGDKNVSEVSYLTGFNSPSYFTKCFTEQFNKKPSYFMGKIENGKS